MNEFLREHWTRSRIFRVVLVLALGYAGLRLVVNALYMTILLAPELGLMELPAWSGSEAQPIIPVDLQVYLDAAEQFRAQEPLYDMRGRIEFFQYSPAYAMAFIPFLWLPAGATVAIHVLLHVAAYILLYFTCDRIFRKTGLAGARRALALTLPVWLIFTSFWSDLGYLNVYIIVALLGTLLIEAVLDEHVGWALLWLSLILQSKPHWAFALAIPFLLGRHRFFARLMALAAPAYVAIVGITMWAGGPAYVLGQYGAYVRFLATMGAGFRWAGTEAAYLGYNHSIKQIVFYLLGVTPSSALIASGIKGLLLAPLALVGIRCLLHPGKQPRQTASQLALDLAFATYLGVFIWLDWVWEVSLSPVLLAYLLGTVVQRKLKGALWAVFLPYGLIDVVRLVSFAALGMDAIAPGLYVITDPSLYVPLMMIVILVFYAVLVTRIWRAVFVSTNTYPEGEAVYGL